MNILVIASWYINENNSIRGSFFREQAIALKKSGHKVTLISVEQLPGKKCFSHYANKYREYLDEGVRTIIYYQVSFGSRPHLFHVGKKEFEFDPYLNRNLAGYKKLFMKLKRENEEFDIIHAHSFIPGGYSACVLKNIFNAPIVITEHFSGIPAGKLSKHRLVGLKYTVEQSDAFYCVSDNLAQHVKRITGTNKTIGVIPNILSPLFFYDSNEKKYEKFTIVSVGQLIPRKRMDLLIDSFNNAFTAEDNVQLIIAGDGDSRNSLQEQIDQLGLSNKITLLGRISRSDLSDLMRKCHAFVLMSKLETFGVVYIEAMACGLPTIGTYNGGSDEILNSFECFGLKVDDKEGLINLLKALYQGDVSVNSKTLSEQIQKAYGEESIVYALNQAYNLARGQEIAQ